MKRAASTSDGHDSKRVKDDAQAAAPAPTAQRPVVVWIRSDLRISDNSALTRASRIAVADGNPLVVMFVVSPGEWLEHDMAAIKCRFILHCVSALRDALALLNVSFVTLTAPTRRDVPQVVCDAVVRLNANRILWNIEYEIHETQRDKKVTKLLAERQIPSTACHDQCILMPGKARTKEGKVYTVFTPFKKTWITILQKDPSLYKLQPMSAPLPVASPALLETINAISTVLPTTVPQPFEAPSQELIDFADKKYPAGEANARIRLESFVKARIKGYKNDRDSPGKDLTSRLSAYLALGVISPRECLVEVLTSNNQKFDSGSDGAVTWISELCWRDFYKNILIEYPRVCKNQPFKLETDNVTWTTDPESPLFKAWCTGHTGYPIVDAGMRQLLAEGWMHNRVRMIVASFLTKDLGIDWRLGEKHFMRHLIDGDLASNNGGWQWAASTGTDSQPYFRIFNPTLQSEKFDPAGSYIRKFVPELKSVLGKEIHDPKGKLGLPRIAKLGYVAPIVDHKIASQAFLEAFKRGIGK
ncbi:deoxyribodipyrimidine photo-lyase [Chytriomyces cf. hyalinus JEL632]|nr:deoxyribodipyrimidine photo-lyase [Chytriomyces cf. hyalinus JEL632]